MDRFSIARGISSIEAEIEDLRLQKEEAVMAQDFEKAVRIREKQDKLTGILSDMEKQEKNPFSLWAPDSSTDTWIIPPELYSGMVRYADIVGMNMGVDISADTSSNNSIGIFTFSATGPTLNVVVNPAVPSGMSFVISNGQIQKITNSDTTSEV